MTATLTLATAITASDYTVTVTPKDTTVKPVTATVKGAKSVLTTLKFASDKLVLLNNVGTQGSVVVNGYDQFGEKVAISDSNTTFYATGATKKSYTSDTGVLVLEAQNSAYPFVVGNTVAVTAVYNNGTTVLQQAATLKVSAAAYVKSLEFGELATTNTALQGKKVTISNFADGSYYYPIKATNQYDQALSATDLTNMKAAGTLIVSPTNAGYAYIDSFATLKDGTVIAKVKKGTPALIPTTVPLTLVSVGGGTFSKSLVIEDDPYIATLNVQIPETYSDKKTEVTVSATDQNGEAYDFYNTAKATGNTITFGDTNSLTGSSSKIEATTGTFSMVKDTTKKTVTFYYTCTNSSATAIKDNIVVTTAKPAVSALSVTVNPSGTVNKLQGIASGVSTTLSAGDSIDLSTVKNLVFLDNYGAVMTAPSVTFDADGTSNDATGVEYRYTVAMDGSLAGTAGYDDDGVIAYNDYKYDANATKDVTRVMTVTLWKVTAKSGTATNDTWEKVNSVETSVKFNKQAVSYSISLDDGGLLYTGATSGDTDTVIVKKTVDGVTTTMTADGTKNSTDKFYLTDDLGLVNASNSTVDGVPTVAMADNTTGKDVINVWSNGEIIGNITVDYSNVAPKEAKATWTKTVTSKTDAADKVTLNAANYTFNDGVFTIGDYSLGIVDQYGQAVKSNVVVKLNGNELTAAAAASSTNLLKAGGENTVTITKGSVTKTVTIVNNAS